MTNYPLFWQIPILTNFSLFWQIPMLTNYSHFWLITHFLTNYYFGQIIIFDKLPTFLTNSYFDELPTFLTNHPIFDKSLFWRADHYCISSSGSFVFISTCGLTIVMAGWQLTQIALRTSPLLDDSGRYQSNARQPWFGTSLDVWVIFGWGVMEPKCPFRYTKSFIAKVARVS